MWIVDRFEEGFVVLEREDGTFETVSRELLPQDTREGSVLIMNEKGVFALDPAREQARRETLYQMQEDIFT